MKKLFTFLLVVTFYSSSFAGATFEHFITEPGPFLGACSEVMRVCWDDASEVPNDVINYEFGDTFTINGDPIAGGSYNASQLCFNIFTATPSGSATCDRVIQVPTTNTVIAIGNVTFEFTPDGSSLPIELSAFTADYSERNQDVEIKFSTASQLNVEMIELQRSVNNRDFETIKTFGNIEDAAEENQYRFVDNRFGAASNLFYQLKSTDWDGSFEFSEIVSVAIQGRRVAVNLFPNPAKGQISINATINGKVQFIGLKGAVVLNTEIFEGDNNVDISNLAAGVYMAIYTNENFDTVTKRFVVSK